MEFEARLRTEMDAKDPGAAERLLPLVYDQLRGLAQRLLASEQPGQTLQATALVHEAYLRVLGPDGAGAEGWEGRGHFFASAARAMRRILVDRARAKGAAKRGGDRRRLELDLGKLTMDDIPAELLDLDEALDRLAAEDPDKAQLVELRFFGGLTMKQAANLLGISGTTADRHWAFARAWLSAAMSGEV